jgi:hypothetical protein
MRFRKRLRLAAVVGLAELGAVACSLDFDRFDAEDASTEAAPSPAPPPKGMDAGSGSVPDVASPKESSAVMPEASPTGCAAAADCVDKAQTCGARCATTLAQCTKGCGGAACERRCTTADQTCISQCADSCDLCVQLGGCGSRNGCTPAAQGDL